MIFYYMYSIRIPKYVPTLLFRRIVKTGLEELPNLNGLNSTSVLHMV